MVTTAKPKTPKKAVKASGAAKAVQKKSEPKASPKKVSTSNIANHNLDADEIVVTEEVIERVVSPRNTLNALTAKEWITETVSVWRQRGLGRGHPDTAIERQHPAPFSFTDVARLVRFFTKPGQTVLDPFVGIGSTLKAAALEGRNGIGIELEKEFVKLSKERLKSEVDLGDVEPTSQEILQGDARKVMATLEDDSVDLVITSPPYWNILHKKDHKAIQEREAKGLKTRYSDAKADLGNIPVYDDFLDELTGILVQAKRVLKHKKYMAIIVSDFREGPRLRMFHADIASRLEREGFVLQGITILHQAHKRVFPYGYPASYVPNIHHQYIVILRNDRLTNE
jgi:DNA modification methylase